MMMTGGVTGGARSKSEMGFYGGRVPPKTPSSSMWDSLGMNKRPSQKDLLATTPMERREYTMQQGAHMHLHKHCISPDGLLRAANTYTMGGVPGRNASTLPFGKGEKGGFSMKEFRAMVQQHKNMEHKSMSMDSDSSGLASPVKGTTSPLPQAAAVRGAERVPSVPRALSLAASGGSDGKAAGGKGNPPAISVGSPTEATAPRMLGAMFKKAASGEGNGGSDRWNRSFKTAVNMDGESPTNSSAQGAFLDRIRRMGAGHIQGKEFVRTLTRRRNPATVSHNPVIDNPFVRHTKKQRDEFCALIMGGSQDNERLSACRAALEKDPNERSLHDFERLLEFSRRCDFLMDLTPVERFIFLRSARMLRIKAGGAVDGQLSRVFVVLSGTIVGQKYGVEVVHGSGDAFGKMDMVEIARTSTENDQADEELEEKKGPAFWAEGGPLACRADADVLSVDEWDFERMWKAYNKTAKDGQSSKSYVATFLSSLDLFRYWNWSDMQDLMLEVEGMQVDRGMVLFREGDVVDGVHVLQFGECRVERSDPSSSPPKRYGLQASVGAGDDGLPKLSVHRHMGPKSVALAVCGPRTVFGEEITGAFGGRGQQGDADTKRGYQVTCISDCWFLFIPKRLWKDMLHDKRRHERFLRSIDCLKDVTANREEWVSNRWKKEQEIQEISQSKLPLLSRRSGARWSL